MDHLATVCTVRILLTASTTVTELHRLQNGVFKIEAYKHFSFDLIEMKLQHSWTGGSGEASTSCCIVSIGVDRHASQGDGTNTLPNPMRG